VLGRSGIFLNTSSDLTILERTLEAAAQLDDDVAPPDDATMGSVLERVGAEPLFVPGLDDVGPAPAG
jgi:hypothetical protein